jgi:uncharacterized Tic20 family protein
MSNGSIAIAPEERGLASITHLTGLAGYIIPFGGVLVPIVIWIVKKDSPVISNIAKQAILLNIVVFLLAAVSIPLVITIILIPILIVFWCALGIVAVALPVVGAIKANQGTYYRYPVIGTSPS